MAEFLPLCDVLFTIISLAGYFCDVIFDLVMTWALAGTGRTLVSIATLLLICNSLIVSQIISLRWYLHAKSLRATEANPKSLYKRMTVYFAVGLHVMQCGVLWRYAKLFIPVDLKHVKHEVRDLCMLRLMHAFLEAAPMLLIQVYLLMCPQMDVPTSKPFEDLNIVSASLSLFSVCWALASFSKNVRLHNVHRLVLTWLGVIFQFLWRLGTVSSRVIALTIFASLYGPWIFFVIVFHWSLSFLWLISPKNVFHGEKISKPRKAYLSALIAFIYVFAYVNLQEVNHRQKMAIFYVVMWLENTLLIIAWLLAVGDGMPPNWYMIPLLSTGLFAIGIAFMLLYYRYFHVRRLGYEAGGRFPQTNGYNNYCLTCNGMCQCEGNQCIIKTEPIPNGPIKTNWVNGQGDAENMMLSDSSKVAPQRYHQHAIPGVFNCRFSNPVLTSAFKRKKKKPTSFIPPPNIVNFGQSFGPASIPFWRRPLPNQHNHTAGSSENEGSSVGSRVNIQQKLQEKKQKQLAELKIIQEEIKQGKLGGPGNGSVSNGHVTHDDIINSLPRQPIPRAKKHVEPIYWPPPSPDFNNQTNEINNLSHNKLSNLYAKYNVQNATTTYPYHELEYNITTAPNQTSQNKRKSPTDDATFKMRHLAKYPLKSHRTRSDQPYEFEHFDMKRQSPMVLMASDNQHRVGSNVLMNQNGHNYNNPSPSLMTSNAGVVMTTTAALLEQQRKLLEKRTGQFSPRPMTDSLYYKHETNDSDNDNKVIAGNRDDGVENKRLINDQQRAIFTENLRMLSDHAKEVREARMTYEHARGNSLDNTIHCRYNAQMPPRSFMLDHAKVPPPSYQPPRKLTRKRSNTPEILLAPYYLENEWPPQKQYFDNLQQLTCELNSVSDNENPGRMPANDVTDDSTNNIYKAYLSPSDIDSQVSLPRSYTLPRQFKYCGNRIKVRKLVRTEHFINSTNSSDGDVDSADDNESDNTSMSPTNTMHHNNPSLLSNEKHGGKAKTKRRPFVYRSKKKPETKL